MDLSTLFDIYSQNLAMYDSRYPDCIVCPLCFRLLNRESLVQKQITLEHIIPSAIGGNILTITCKACNNRHGTELDAHLVQQLRKEDILGGRSNLPLRARIGVGEAIQTADIYFSDENPNVRIVGIPEHSNPRSVEQIIEELQKDSSVDIQVHVSLEYNQQRSDAAKLRAGYLLAFHNFGYGYIVNKNLEQLRKVFSSPVSPGIWKQGVLRLNDYFGQTFVGLLREPKELQCFFTVLDLTTQIERSVGVILPGFGSESADIYERWAAIPEEEKRNLNATITKYPFGPAVLIHPDFRDIPYMIWQSRSLPKRQ